VIKLETIYIEELRGIRKLKLELGQKTFAISGPNGSGKSGVIDAIEFGLTGQIGRLSGRGTKGLSVTEHGPHVDKSKFPEAAFVELKVYLPTLRKSATIMRTISEPKKPKITPFDPDIKAVLAKVAEHPELTLSRREILRFILIEPTKRSEEVQTILKLESVGHIRSALNTAHNRLQTALKGAIGQTKSAQETLQRHINIATLQAKDLIEAVNTRRKVLGVELIPALTADTKLDAGLTSEAGPPPFNKQSALRDLNALSEKFATFAEVGKSDCDGIIAGLKKLEDDPALFAALQDRALIEKGLDLVQGPACPLCDREWENEAALLAHLKAKFAKSDEAGKLQTALLKHGTALSGEIAKLTALISAVERIASGEQPSFAQSLSKWRGSLDELKGKLTSLDGLADVKSRIEDGWLGAPKNFAVSFASLTDKVNEKPDQTAMIDAQTFLSLAQTRLEDFRESRRKEKAAKIACDAAEATYETYCRVMEDELNQLYDDVQEEFSAFYRQINQDDESKFTAKLTPTAGRLDFDVNFYERGLFPPAAYHSEGHQDGMGVCLYLALMKRLLGDGFSLALLDDVVMSVDSGHRREFCRLLKTNFPDTQFIITTHDRLWAEQMKSEGLVTAKTSIAFYGWSIETGPLVESNEEIWQEIEGSLVKGKVGAAAGTLRRHLEYLASVLADGVGGQPRYHADGNYDLGELLPAALSRVKKLFGQAADAAQSWSNDTEKATALTLKDALSKATTATNIEQWAVNKAIHYNAWANFDKNDFAPVVSAFKALLDCLRCKICDSWLYVVPPRGTPEALRCNCGKVNLNLNSKAR
jgi:hypothetical protein